MNKKDTIYIDVDDEITAVIHKVITSKAKLIVLVLPKRASVFHSSVNLKLLKNKALKASKSVVLVSTDANLLSLAGVVGLNVAKNLQDKPSIPKVNLETDDSTETIDSEDKTISESTKSIGEVAALSSVGVSDINDPDVIEFDNDAKDEDSVKSDKTKSKEGKGQKIDKKLKVPDFGRFQKILIISAVAIIALVALYIVGFVYLPKAKITIQSSTSTISNTIPLTLDSTQTSLSATNMVAPANLQTIQKTVTSSAVNTTGTKQVGIYATGSITVTTNSGNNSSTDIPAGTVFTGVTNGLTYQSISDTTIDCNPPAPFLCPAGSSKVNVEATQYGTNYNFPSQGYTTDIGGLSGVYTGSKMSGANTPSNVQIVTQADIDAATKQLVAPNATTIEQQLAQAIKAAGYTPLATTFVAATPVITPSNSVGTQTNTVTASGVYSYTLYGAFLSDLDTFITNQINRSSSFNSSKQSILNTGSAKATFTVDSSTATAIKVSMLVSSVIGPKINIAQLKTQSAGQPNATIINNISSIPGVKSVTIKYSPFWVTSMPHSTKKITIIVEKADGTAA
jgi:cell division protein FtsL/copper chaperone CopZ